MAQKQKRVRVTYVIPETVDRNIEVYAVSAERLKSDVVVEALSRYLRKRGLQPNKLPVVSAFYD